MTIEELDTEIEAIRKDYNRLGSDLKRLIKQRDDLIEARDEETLANMTTLDWGYLLQNGAAWPDTSA